MEKKWFYLGILPFLLLAFLYDKQIILFIAQNRIGILNGIMIWLTNILTIIVMFVLMTTLFLKAENKREWIIPLWVSIGISAAVTMFIKIIISRTRPFETLALPLVQGMHYVFSTWDMSFPSMHTATVFSLVPILGEEFPKLKWFWIILASLISFSRIYLGVHYLSDVLSGCLIGLLIGFIILHLEKKYKWLRKWKIKKK